MSLSGAQCRAGRALIGWSQDQLAAASKVAKATVAAFETTIRLPQQRTLDQIQKALEDEGVEFLNGGQPGVRLKPKDEKNMDHTFEPLHIVSSSDLSVRLNTYDNGHHVHVVVE